MNINIFRDDPYEKFVSMEVVADNIFTGLVKQFKDEININELKPDFNKYSISKLPLDNKKLLFQIYKYWYYPRSIRDKNSQINHIIDQSYGHLVNFLDPKKTIVTCHDLMPLKVEHGIVKKHSFFRPGLVLAKYSYRGLKKAAKIIADSESTKKDLIDLLKISEEKIVVIPLAVSPFFSKCNVSEKEYAYQKFNIQPNDCYYIFHVGSTASYKNFPGLLETLKILVHEKKLNVKFIRAGAPFTKEYEELSKKMEISDRIIYLGKLSDHDLRMAYNIADVFFFPSLYEGFGLPVLEAMACGTPVVISNAPSLIEIAGDAALKKGPNDYDGFANVIKQLLADNNFRQEMIKKGLERKDYFTWEKTAESVFSVYQEINKTNYEK